MGRMKSLREFAAEHGHCKPTKEHPTLGSFTSNMRNFFILRERGEKTSLTDERIVSDSFFFVDPFSIDSSHA